MEMGRAPQHSFAKHARTVFHAGLLLRGAIESTRSAAAAPGNVIVIQSALLTFTQIGFIRSAFLFAHIGEHFAIPASRVINDELLISRLFEFLDLPFEVFPALLELSHLPVGVMNLKPDDRI